MMAGSLQHFFRAVVIAGSLGGFSQVAEAYAEQGRGGSFSSRDCSKIPTIEGFWISDCSLRYTESGQFLVEKLHRNELRRQSGSRSFLSIEKDLHLYLK